MKLTFFFENKIQTHQKNKIICFNALHISDGNICIQPPSSKYIFVGYIRLSIYYQTLVWMWELKTKEKKKIRTLSQNIDFFNEIPNKHHWREGRNKKNEKRSWYMWFGSDYSNDNLLRFIKMQKYLHDKSTVFNFRLFTFISILI